MGFGRQTKNVYVYTGGFAGLKKALETKNYIDLGELGGGNTLWVSLKPDYAYMHMQKEPGRVLWQIIIPPQIWTLGRSENRINPSKANPSANYEIDEAFIGNNMPPIEISEIKNYHGGKVLIEP